MYIYIRFNSAFINCNKVKKNQVEKQRKSKSTMKDESELKDEVKAPWDICTYTFNFKLPVTH